MHAALLILFSLVFCFNSQSSPPAPVPFLIQHDYDANIDLFGGGNYVAPHDNLIPSSAPA